MSLNQKQAVLILDVLVASYRAHNPPIPGAQNSEQGGSAEPDTIVIGGVTFLNDDLDTLQTVVRSALESAAGNAMNERLALDGYRNVLDAICLKHEICDKTLYPPTIGHEDREGVATILLLAAGLSASAEALNVHDRMLLRLGQIMLAEVVDQHGLALDEKRAHFLRMIARAAGLE